MQCGTVVLSKDLATSSNRADFGTFSLVAKCLLRLFLEPSSAFMALAGHWPTLSRQTPLRPFLHMLPFRLDSAFPEWHLL
jgi:hypothetical protein